MFDGAGARSKAIIAAHPGDTEAALAAYEGAMFARSESEAAADAHLILELCLGDRAPTFGLIDFFTGASEEEHEEEEHEGAEQS